MSPLVASPALHQGAALILAAAVQVAALVASPATHAADLRVAVLVAEVPGEPTASLDFTDMANSQYVALLPL